MEIRHHRGRRSAIIGWISEFSLLLLYPKHSPRRNHAQALVRAKDSQIRTSKSGYHWPLQGPRRWRGSFRLRFRGYPKREGRALWPPAPLWRYQPLLPTSGAVPRTHCAPVTGAAANFNSFGACSAVVCTTPFAAQTPFKARDSAASRARHQASPVASPKRPGALRTAAAPETRHPRAFQCEARARRAGSSERL
eukprot:scaffold331_cov243-Pinguiococcus_pyrenoidosus.AAC.4